VIVIISHPQDLHALRVRELLEAGGHPVLLLNLTDLPDRGRLTLDYQDRRLGRIEYTLDGTGAVDLTRARSVWWRRPQSPNLAQLADPDVYAFTHNEWQEAINGLWQVLDAPWMNPPAKDEVAGRKLLQLKRAAELGLRIPRTLVTSNPDEARAFVNAHGIRQTIFKTFSCTHAIWRETRLVGEREFDLLDQVRLAPVIFQEYVQAEADLRVTVVGRKIFACAIDSRETDYPVDFRMSLGQARTGPTDLPAEITERLFALMDRLGLVYGAIDLRRTPDGEHVFLEVNTAGEFLFVQERTGLPIAEAVADWLARPV
jgi:glutathione synthase/RimK-type ligase-like ATP-grasp enzyme